MDNLEAILKDLKEIKSEVRTIRLGLYYRPQTGSVLINAGFGGVNVGAR